MIRMGKDDRARYARKLRYTPGFKGSGMSICTVRATAGDRGARAPVARAEGEGEAGATARARDRTEGSSIMHNGAAIACGRELFSAMRLKSTDPRMRGVSVVRY